MRSIPWDTFDSNVITVRATIGGRPVRVVEADDISRDLPQSFPGQTSISGGVAAATGKLVIAPEIDVTDRVGTPWTRSDYPQRGQRVGVWVSHGGQEVKIFTGRVDSVHGSVADPLITVDLVDDFDQLQAFASHTAMSRMMPPLSTLGDGFQRMTGLLTTWVTDFAARAAGYYATPPMDGYCLVSAPLQGSTWPERGQLRDSYRGDDVGIWHKYHPGAGTEPAGWISMSYLYAAYEPDPYNTPYNSGITSARPLNLTMMAGQSQATSSYVAARWANGYTLRIACTSGRAIVAQVVTADNVVTTVATITSTAAGAWTTATARWRPSGSASLTVDITTDTGVTTTGSITPLSTSGVFDNPIYQIRVYAPQGTYLAGVQASFTSSSPASSWNRTFVHRPKTPLRNMYLIPGITARPAVDILQDQAKAEGSALWLDEDGVLQYRDRGALVQSNPVKTLTAERDIEDLEWTLSSRDVHRTVSVKYRQPTVSISRRSTLLAYEGSRNEMGSGDDLELWVEPPKDEEWIMVDSTPRTVYSDYNYEKVNDGLGSFIGFTGLSAKGDEIPDVGSMSGIVSMDFNRVGARAWKHTLSLGTLPSSVDRVVTKTRSSEGSPIKNVYRDMGLPVLRCMGKGTWSDQEETSPMRGPSWATDYDHDAGWYVQDASHARALADAIAAETSTLNAVIDRLPIRADPRLQVGDVVNVQDKSVSALSIKGVICSISQTIESDDHTMEIRLLVISVETPYVTIDDFDDWYSGLTLDQLDSKLSGITLDQLDNNPLR